MCEWCDENNGEPIGCQNCGTSICLDDKNVYVTTYGDVYCNHCGREEQRDIEEAEAEEASEWGWMDYGSGWFDPDMDFENEESNGVYIGERDDDIEATP